MKRYKNSHPKYQGRRYPRNRQRSFWVTILVGGFLIYALFAWFLPTLIGGLSFLNKFKPAQKATPPVSESATLAPPVLNIPYEATNSATINVKGYSVPNTDVEIYLDDELKSTTKANEDGSFIATSIDLNLGTNNIYGKTIDEKGNKSLPSKNIQIQYINEKPNLEISQPPDNQIIKGTKKIQVSGTVDSKNSISVTINGTLAITGSDGAFSQTIDLNDGNNSIVVVATDQAGNTAQITRQVTYEP